MRFPRLWWMALVAALLMVAWGVSPLSAEGDEIVVRALEVTSEFPQGIHFRVDVESPAPITDITVRFNVVGQQAARYHRPDISPGTSVQAEFLVRTDTLQRYIPPGSDIQYFLEIRAQGGQELMTEPRQFTYLDARFDWEEEREGNVSILYYGPVGPQARTMLYTVVLTLADMQPLLGVTLVRPLRLVMYNSVADMLDALPLVSAVLRQQLVTEGQTHAAEGIILLLGSAPSVVDVASHEVIHVLMYEAADNPFHLTPAWLNEGMAEYGNKEPTSSYGLALEAAVAEDHLIPLRQLTTRPGLAEDIILLYGEGKSFVAFLIDTFGAERLRQMLRLFKGGRSINEAFQRAYGAGLDELENRWRGSLGASPIRVSQEPQARVTPTPIPTLPPLTLSTPAPAATSGDRAPETTSPAEGPDAEGVGGFSCGASPGGTAAIDLSLALLALGLVTLAARGRR